MESSALPLRSDAAADAAAIRPTSPGASPVGASTTTALRCWLQAKRRAHTLGSTVEASEVRGTMRRLVEAGRARGARVEQLIVLLKELWATLPEAADGDGRHADRSVRSRVVLDGIVRVCIEEFYASAPATAGRVAADGRLGRETRIEPTAGR